MPDTNTKMAKRALLQTGAAPAFSRLDSSIDDFEELPVPFETQIGPHVPVAELSFEERLQANPFIIGLRRPAGLEVAKLHVSMLQQDAGRTTSTEDVAGPGGKHESVFAIKYNDFNNKKFWCLIAMLFLYTLIIELVKQKVVQETKEDRCNRAFVERMFAEVMVFGVVAMSVFVSSQFFTMSMETFHIFEFADILISFGALFLLVAGLAFTRLRKVEDAHLEKLYEQDHTQVMTAIKEATNIKDLSPLVLDRAVLEVTRSQFYLQHRLDESTFSWSIYLIESLNAEICKFIHINQFTWLSLMGISAWIWAVHISFGHGSSGLPALFAPSANLTTYMIQLNAANWMALILLLIVGLQAHRVRQMMKHMLGVADIEELRVATGASEQTFRTIDTFGMRKEHTMEVLVFRCNLIFQAAQVLAVCTSVLLGFYLMHVLYNLVAYKMPWWWHALFLVPQVLAFGLVLPYILTQYTHVHCFVDPEVDVMDSVIEIIGEAWQDLRFVEKQLGGKAQTDGNVETTDEYYKWAMQECEKAGRNLSKSGIVDGQFSQDDFRGALKLIGVHVSQARAKRLFKLLAHGQHLLRYEDFVKQVLNARPAQPRRGGRRPTILISDGDQSKEKQSKHQWMREKSLAMGIIGATTSQSSADCDKDSSDEGEHAKNDAAVSTPRLAAASGDFSRAKS